jgi:hypothetical protein
MNGTEKGLESIFFLGLLGLKQRKLIVVDNLSHFSFEKYKTYNSFTI